MNVVFFGLEFILVSALLLGAYRLESKLGMSAVVAAVASLQFVQAILAASYFWPVAEGLYINPGSAILFAGNLAILLYAYARDGVLRARIVLYAVLIGNVVPGLVGALIGWHVTMVEPHNLLEVPVDIFHRGIAVSAVGIILLYVDQLLAVVSFSWLRRKLPQVPVALHMSAALIAALTFDTVAFVSILFWGEANFDQLLLSGLLSKALGGLAYGILWGVYAERHNSAESNSPRQVLDILLFKEDLASLRAAATTDPMTGLLNRRAFNMMLEQWLDQDDGEPSRFALVLCDADRFKQINDTLGHAEGDRVLEQIAQSITEAVREDDLAFRLGGDEFLILLPEASLEQARDVASRIGRFEFSHPKLGHPITLTIGIAAHPQDGRTHEALFEAADRRLYEGKTRGRNQIVTSRAL
jgi:diguanylate cyclase (GGDEF)-like protein